MYTLCGKLIARDWTVCSVILLVNNLYNKLYCDLKKKTRHLQVKSLETLLFLIFLFLKKLYYAHKACIHLIKNSIIITIMSEGLCDTVMADKNSALHHRNKLSFKLFR